LEDGCYQCENHQKRESNDYQDVRILLETMDNEDDSQG
jgi:hypothetical protein